MIPRYTRREMGDIWSEENKYRIWLEIEVLTCEAQAELGLIPAETAKIIRERADFDVARIEEIEETTKHDVIAFLTNVEEYVGEPSRYIHLGMTSSDILDTCLAVQMAQAGEIIMRDLERMRDVLADKAREHKYTICVGRTHGIHAEPTTFGLKCALWHEECVRNIARFSRALDEAAQGKINGAVGTFEHINPFVEKYVCDNLGLRPSTITTQVIQRDIHANYLSAIALIGAMLEKISIEIRHLQRTEVLEAEEYFSKGQKGSSAMPHKRNPISSENISGQARLLRANLIPALENNALWHERDISHSSVERIILPDSTISVDYILNRMANVVEKLVVYPKNMIRNMNITNGLIYSQKVLIELAKRGLKRQQAYEMVQRSAMRTWSEQLPFLDSVLENEEIMEHLGKEDIEKLFDSQDLMKSVDFIFERCGL
ncbi:MAG: adenylosuccinate lyase [Candidatus Kapaibacterium sp.]